MVVVRMGVLYVNLKEDNATPGINRESARTCYASSNLHDENNIPVVDVTGTNYLNRKNPVIYRIQEYTFETNYFWLHAGYHNSHPSNPRVPGGR